MGHGALILGHSHPAIVQAVQEQMAKGVHYGENHELEVEWAELIKSMMPMAERGEFCSCGQEADMMAIRLGRTFTGRRKVLRMDGQVPLDVDFVRALPDLAHKYGTVWALDEVVTGFRDAPGGWQSMVDVKPDLTTLGKCVGGGLPVGVVAGRAG